MRDIVPQFYLLALRFRSKIPKPHYNVPHFYTPALRFRSKIPKPHYNVLQFYTSTAFDCTNQYTFKIANDRTSILPIISHN